MGSTVLLEPFLQTTSFCLFTLRNHDDEGLFCTGKCNICSVKIVNDYSFAFLGIICFEDGLVQSAIQGDGEKDIVVDGLFLCAKVGEIDLEGRLLGFAPDDVVAACTQVKVPRGIGEDDCRFAKAFRLVD